MSSADIQVFNESGIELPFSTDQLPAIASTLANEENCSFNFVEVVYVDEEEILRINKEHLDHDYVTDIITFRYDDASDDKGIEGTLFCCASRIKEQAAEFNASPEKEFLRIFIHGLLHLTGYDDKSKEQQQQMTAKEDHYLAMV